MIDNLLGGDDEDGPDEGTDDMDGGLFEGDEGGDELMDGGGDDELMDGGDDLMGGDDELMGDDGMGFDEMEEDGAATSAEMDNRIDELENEVASLSSTVNTVKSENEQISESLEDVEENIRKLLEVYEMVTRGVNPFVDENEMGNAFDGGGGGGGGGGSMGLFGDDEDEEDAETEVDESVANADADAFFDDDLDEDPDDGGDDFDDLDDAEDLGGGDDFDDFDEGGDDLGGDDFDDFDDDLGGGDDLDGGGDDLDDDGGGGGGDGKSFEELKEEYDSGEADWDDDGAETADATEQAGDDAGGGDVDDAMETTGTETMDPLEADGAETESPIEPLEDEPDGSGEPPAEGSGGQDAADTTGDPSPATESAGDARSPVEGGKPYLETLPAGYVADVVVLDWLEFLVDEAGTDGAARTVAYYEAIEWIDEPAAEKLQTFLNGFGGEVEPDPEPRSSLTVSHHNTSLRFISRIANPDMEMVAFDERERDADRAPLGPGSGPAVRVEHPTAEDTPRERGMESDGGHSLSDPRENRGGGPDRSSDPADESAFDWRDGRTE